jgi:hypothetical protein
LPGIGSTAALVLFRRVGFTKGALSLRLNAADDVDWHAEAAVSMANRER